MSTGESALYWANSTLEVIFHEIVSMPTIDSDPQQIQKAAMLFYRKLISFQKRHVGNDFVHIIWSEHLRDYNPLTITSQFNEAHIIIYPLPNGLFRIQTYRIPAVSTHKNYCVTAQVPPYGPLQHGMVVNKELLSILVRETAVNANRALAAYRNPDAYNRPHVKLNSFSNYNKISQPQKTDKRND